MCGVGIQLIVGNVILQNLVNEINVGQCRVGVFARQRQIGQIWATLNQCIIRLQKFVVWTIVSLAIMLLLPIFQGLFPILLGWVNEAQQVDQIGGGAEY